MELQPAGRLAPAANAKSDMPAELLAFIPTALALTLLALAHGLTPKPSGWVLIAALALGLGPLAVALVGFFMWLMLLAAAVVGLTMFAALRYDQRPPRGTLHDAP